jgi:hypothetical protein
MAALTRSGARNASFKGGLASQARTSAGAPWFTSSAKRQAGFVVDCLESICRAGGNNLQNVAWTQNLYSRAEDVFPAIEVWNERFPSEPPASLVIGVGRPILAEGCTIYVDAVAVGDA